MLRHPMWFTSALVALASCFPTAVLAGGPPLLCLPVDGVTADNQQACIDVISNKLEDKLWPHVGRFQGVHVVEAPGQWYVTFHFAEDVKLSDVENALQGSEFTIPRDRLRLFGHVILDVEKASAPQALQSDLEAVEFVSINEVHEKDGRVSITIDMPYPKGHARPNPENVIWDEFEHNDLSSDQATRSKSPITAAMLPGYVALSDVFTRNDVRLQDVRWSTTHACRTLGAVTVSSSDEVAAAAPTRD